MGIKICMGDKLSDEPVGLIDMHFGYRFIVQEDHTLACEVPDELEAVVKTDLKHGRVMLQKTFDKRKAEEKAELEERIRAASELDNEEPVDEKATGLPAEKSKAQEDADEAIADLEAAAAEDLGNETGKGKPAAKGKK